MLEHQTCKRKRIQNWLSSCYCINNLYKNTPVSQEDSLTVPALLKKKHRQLGHRKKKVMLRRNVILHINRQGWGGLYIKDRVYRAWCERQTNTQECYSNWNNQATIMVSRNSISQHTSAGSDSCSWWTGVETNMIGFCCSQAASRWDLLCIPRGL